MRTPAAKGGCAASSRRCTSAPTSRIGPSAIGVRAGGGSRRGPPSGPGAVAGAAAIGTRRKPAAVKVPSAARASHVAGRSISTAPSSVPPAPRRDVPRRTAATETSAASGVANSTS